uniref:Uncharacterized protein n=1 Tax=Rhizophagus irregularis (strain DAOM 181602 / DAOM 197198 / MUCL 43194) TaxID=747089 RepID=U9U9I6_RHIID
MLYVTNGQRLAVGYDNRYYRNIFGEKHLSNIEEIEVFSVSGKDCELDLTKYQGSDKTKWNNEDYESLKETLKQFIPLIRFVEISSKNFYDKVQPYKAIIPNNIYEEIEEFYLKNTLPKTKFYFKSILLKSTILTPRI